MSAKYKSPSFLLPNELNTNTNPLNTDGNPATGTGINSLYSMDFDGTNNVECGNISALNGATQATWSCWYKRTGGGSTYFMGSWGNGANTKQFIAYQFGSQGGMDVYMGKNTSGSNGEHTMFQNVNCGINQNTWHHMVFVFDASESSNADKLKFYLDGTQITNTSAGGSLTSLNSVTTDFILAAPLSSGKLTGNLDEVAVFNRALNTTEIAALYGGTSPNIYPSNLMATDLNPIAYYPLGEQAQNSGYFGNTTPANNVWQFPNGVLQDYVMDFDGTGKIDAGIISSLNNASEFTISTWVKLNDLTNNYRIFGNRESSSPYKGLGVETGSSSNAGKLFFYSMSNNGAYPSVGITMSNEGITANNWFLLTCKYKNSTQEIFINGSSTTVTSGSKTSNVASTTDTTTANFLIGADSISSSGKLNGELSNFQIFNTGIDSTGSNSIQTIYNNGSPLTDMSGFTSLTNWWKLNADSVYTPSVSKYPTALEFPGNAGASEINTGVISSLNNASAFTVSFWMLRTATHSTLNPFFFGNRDSSNSYKGIAFYMGRDSPSIRTHGFYVYSVSGGYAFYEFPANYFRELNTWHHVVLTWDTSRTPNMFVGYWNGGNAVSSNGTPPDTSITQTVSTGDFHIGTDWANTSHFGGQMSNFAIYDSALTADQVSTLFNFGTPEVNTSFSPTHNWKLDNLTTGLNDVGSLASNDGSDIAVVEVNSNVATIPSWKIPSELPITSANYTTALDFDSASSDYIDCGNDASFNFGTGDFTVSSWINISSGNSSYRWIFGYGRTTGLEIGLHNTTNNNLRLWIAGSLLISSESISSDTWHNLIVKRESGSISAFLDNTSLTLSGSGGAGSISNDNAYIGAWGSGVEDYFDGSISNVAVYNSALTAPQVSTLYNNGTPETAISFSPVSWWKLDTGGSTITDYGSGGNTGNNNGASPITSDVLTTQPVNGVSTTLPSTALQQSDLQFDSPYSNYSLSFDGTGQYINCGTSNISELQVLSLSCWFKEVDSSNTGTRAIIANKNYSSNNGVALWIFGSDLIFQIAAQNDNLSWNNSRVVIFRNYAPIGSWNHISCTYDGADAKIYINGVLRNTWTPTQPYTVYYSPTYNELRIANRSDTTGAPFVGKIDETAIFNTALTEAQVLEIYNNGRPKDLTTFSGTAPISWWRLGENAYFINNDITLPNSVSGAPNGVSSGTATSMLSADAPGTYANGIGDGLAVTDRVGEAPLSVANSQSYNMIPDDKVPYVPGYVGAQTTNASEMTFNGVDSFFDTGNIDLGINSTLSMWFKPGTSPAVNDYALIGEGSNGFDYLVRRESGKFYIWVGSSFHNYGSVISNNIIVGSWNFLAIQKAGDTITVYLKNTNGEFNATATNSAWATTSMTFDRIGSRTISPPAQVFSGQIDEVAGFSEALTPDQIKFDLYEATTTGKTADIENNTNLPTPVAWYRMGD